MSKSNLHIEFNKKNQDFKVLLTVDTSEGDYVLYTDNDSKQNKKNISVYAGKIVDGMIEEVKSNDEKELVIEILNNFNKGV